MDIAVRRRKAEFHWLWNDDIRSLFRCEMSRTMQLAHYT